jgi:gliding motility-associated-like protein
MKQRIIMMLTMLGWLATGSHAAITITAIYTDNGDEVRKTESFEAEAPLQTRFEAEVTEIEAGWTLEWRFTHEGAGGGSSVTRYEESPEYTFVDAGKTDVKVYACLNNEHVDSATISVTIYDSILEMPNAFTPNGDGANDTYSAKKNHRSIVEFHAYIFNRWGQKLYEWTDVNGEWDGTYNGHPVKDGVYFVLVNARGADGKEYKIRRDVNLIRRYNEFNDGTGGGDQ